MRSRFLIFIACVILLVVLLIVYYRMEPLRQAPAGGITDKELTSSTSAIVEKTNESTSANENITNQSDIAKWPEILKSYPETYNKPIEFFGLVVDQNDQPLSGVKISLSIQQMASSAGRLHTPNYSLTREVRADGRFDIQNEKGNGISIEDVQLEGYELEPNVCRFYGADKGSFANPVVFKMWSTNAHETLLTGENKFQIVPDGRPYVINLAQNTISETGDGDLKAWIKYSTPTVRGQTNDWSCAIDVLHGELLEESDLSSSMFVAPQEGYAPSFQFQQNIRGGQRGSTGTKRFYLKLKNGQQYGRITIELYAPYNNQVPGLIRLQYAINPSGSRTLH